MECLSLKRIIKGNTKSMKAKIASVEFRQEPINVTRGPIRFYEVVDKDDEGAKWDEYYYDDTGEERYIRYTGYFPGDKWMKYAPGLKSCEVFLTSLEGIPEGEGTLDGVKGTFAGNRFIAHGNPESLIGKCEVEIVMEDKNSG